MAAVMRSSNPVRVIGYAIISADGMIADANGRMPEGLIVAADQAFFHGSLARTDLVVHGRNSHEGGADAARRRRVVLTRATAALSLVSSHPDVFLWNPNGISFAQLLQRLEFRNGDIAVIGGTKVFDLFLRIGYDSFYLSRVAAIDLPNGQPVFSDVAEQPPEHILAGHGLRLQRERTLDEQLILQEWQRLPPA